MSLQFNQIFLAGNLTRDPQLRYLPDSTAVASIGIAINRRWKDKQGVAKEEVTFIDADCWGKTAEMVGKHFTKGQGIMITGRLKLESWEDKNQVKHYKHKVIIEEVKFTDAKKVTDQAAAPPQSSTPSQPAGHTAGDDEPPF